MQKPRPQTRTPVTWLELKDAGQMTESVSYFILRYGKDNLKVHSITNSVGELVNRFSVTLTKEGKEIHAEWDVNELGPKPSNFRPQKIWFNWNLLRIIE